MALASSAQFTSKHNPRNLALSCRLLQENHCSLTHEDLLLKVCNTALHYDPLAQQRSGDGIFISPGMIILAITRPNNLSGKLPESGLSGLS